MAGALALGVRAGSLGRGDHCLLSPGGAFQLPHELLEMGEKPLEQLLFAMLHHDFAKQLQPDDKRLMFLLRHGQLPLAERQDGKDVVVIASVCGTDLDSQDLNRSIETLEAEGIIVLPSNAQAVRLTDLIMQRIKKGA